MAFIKSPWDGACGLKFKAFANLLFGKQFFAAQIVVQVFVASVEMGLIDHLRSEQ